MSELENRVIDLERFQNLGLILKIASGVSYTSQVAGFACNHPTIEGAFFPLPAEPGNGGLYALTQHFRGVWTPITESDAHFVDKVLRRHGYEYLTVDRSNLANSYEAWVHVLLENVPQELRGFERSGAVLTWPNSD